MTPTEHKNSLQVQNGSIPFLYIPKPNTSLNSEFHLRREMIFSAPEWPTLDETISSILEEETRLTHQSPTTRATDSRAALSLHTMPRAASLSKFGIQKRGKGVCEHCKRPGHIKENCYELHGFPDPKSFCDHCKKPGHTRDGCYKLHGYPNEWQQGKFNSNNTRPSQQNRAHQQNRTHRQNRAHLTTSTGELSGSAAQALEEFKSKLILADKDVATAGPSSSISSFYAGTYTGMDNQSNPNNNYPVPWIIDTGATNHMSGSPKEFKTYLPCSEKDKVRIADGSLSPRIH
jgi:hypothetical protein